MNWLIKLAGGRLMMIVYGAAVAALLGYFTQIKVLHVKIDNQDETIAEQHTKLTNLRLTLGNQTTAIENLLIAGDQAASHNADVVTAHELDKEQADKDAVKARARLQAALSDNDCAGQKLPESIRNEF